MRELIMKNSNGNVLFLILIAVILVCFMLLIVVSGIRIGKIIEFRSLFFPQINPVIGKNLVPLQVSTLMRLLLVE